MNAKFCVLATSKNNQPRACIVMPEKAFGDKIIIADCQMSKTRLNIKANETVFVSFYDNSLDRCMKCDGTAKYITGGELFAQVKSKLAMQNLRVAGLVEITIHSIFEHREN